MSIFFVQQKDTNMSSGQQPQGSKMYYQYTQTTTTIQGKPGQTTPNIQTKPYYQQTNPPNIQTKPYYEPNFQTKPYYEQTTPNIQTKPYYQQTTPNIQTKPYYEQTTPNIQTKPANYTPPQGWSNTMPPSAQTKPANYTPPQTWSGTMPSDVQTKPANYTPPQGWSGSGTMPSGVQTKPANYTPPQGWPNTMPSDVQTKPVNYTPPQGWSNTMPPDVQTKPAVYNPPQGSQGSWQGTNGQQGCVVQGSFNQGSQSYWQGNYGQQGNMLDPNREYMIFTALDKTGVDEFVLDVSQQNDETRNKMLLWTRSGDKNQRFRFENAGNGKYRIVSSGWAIQASGSNGSQLLVEPKSSTQNQLWQIVPASDYDGYYIKSSYGLVMDVNKQKKKKGAQVIQYQFNGGKNQIWQIKLIP